MIRLWHVSCRLPTCDWVIPTSPVFMWSKWAMDLTVHRMDSVCRLHCLVMMIMAIVCFQFYCTSSKNNRKNSRWSRIQIWCSNDYWSWLEVRAPVNIRFSISISSRSFYTRKYSRRINLRPSKNSFFDADAQTDCHTWTRRIDWPWQCSRIGES